MRIKGLDFLRGIAIIGVLFRHIETDFFLAGPGGYGVDLFFVLSGFLVSGLLFSEFKKRGKINIKRFLIRRGFKIYPSFYVFIIATLLIFNFVYGASFSSKSILSEIFFLQSYLGGMWSHTWSLAVEEHFYFLLAFVVYISLKRGVIGNGKSLPIILAVGIILSLVLRVNYVWNEFSKTREAFFYTHLRIDGLFTGALVGYLFHFNPKVIRYFYEKQKLFAFAGFLMILPCFFLNSGTIFMVTIGFNLLHAGFAIILLLLIGPKGESILSGNKMASKFTSLIAFVGVYSYSIYLWHLPVQNVLLRIIPNLRVEAVTYLITSIALGIVASILVEKPMLRVREIYFPGNK